MTEAINDTHTRWVYRHRETGLASSTTNEAEAHRLADGMGVACVSKTAESWAAIDGKGAGAQFFYEDALAGVDSGKDATAGCEIWTAAKKLAVCDPELAQAILEGFRRAFAKDQANGVGIKPGLMAFAAMLEAWIGIAPAYIAEMNLAEPVEQEEEAQFPCLPKKAFVGFPKTPKHHPYIRMCAALTKKERKAWNLKTSAAYEMGRTLQFYICMLEGIGEHRRKMAIDLVQFVKSMPIFDMDGQGSTSCGSDPFQEMWPKTK